MTISPFRNSFAKVSCRLILRWTRWDSASSALLEFRARHGIGAVGEHLPMSEFDRALDHLRADEPRYRTVLDN